MARNQGDHDDFRDMPRNKLGWQHFRDQFNMNEYNSDCASSDPEISSKKIVKNQTKKSDIPTEQHKKSDKVVRDRQKKLRGHNTKILKQSQLDKTYQRKNTKPNPCDIIQVKSLEAIKSCSMDRCYAKYSQYNEEKIMKTKNLKKKKLRRPKLTSSRHSNTSASSASSPLIDEKYVIPHVTLSRNGVYKNNYKVPKKVVKQKLREKSNQCCDCSVEDAKSSRVQSYSKYNRRREVPRERIYKRQESPQLLQEFAKKREMVHKVRGECQMGTWSHGSPCNTQKLCRMLKTREARRFMGCRCVDSDNTENFVLNCQCPECPCDGTIIDDTTHMQQIHNDNSRRIISEDGEMCRSELNSSIVCNCKQPQLDTQHRHIKIDTDNRRNMKEMNLSHDAWQHCDKYSRTADNEYQTEPRLFRGMYRNSKTIRKVSKIGNNGMAENLEDRKISQVPSMRTRDASTCWRKETADRVVQCDEESTSSNVRYDKFNDDQDPVEAVASLCEKLIMINRETESQCYYKAPYNTCHTDECKYKPTVQNPQEKIESNHNFEYPQYKKSKSRIKRHQFAFPKIIKPESNNEMSGTPKMFVYSADDEDGSPLSLYKTGSFVKCAIKRNNNVGNKYYVAYIQKYVSPAWKTDDNYETEIKSTEYLSSDDYG